MLSAAGISAILHQPISRDLPNLATIFPSEASPLSSFPSTHGLPELHRRGNCISVRCKERTHHTQPQIQRASSQRTSHTSRESRSRSPTPNESPRSRLSSPADSSPPRSTGPSRQPSASSSEQLPMYFRERLGRTLPLEDFGTRFRREMARNNLVKSAINTRASRGATPPSSQPQSIDASSQVSSLGAESIAPKSGGSSSSRSSAIQASTLSPNRNSPSKIRDR